MPAAWLIVPSIDLPCRGRRPCSAQLSYRIPYKNETLGHENHLLNHSPLCGLRHRMCSGGTRPTYSDPRFPTEDTRTPSLLKIRVCAPAEEPCGHKQALRGVTSHLVTDMCMYCHGIIGVSPHDYGRALLWQICPTHAVSVTYRLGVTAAG